MDTKRAVHLYNLALYNPLNAILSNHAVTIDNFAYENGINMPAGITHCSSCGIMHIPGLTSSSRITYTRKSKEKSKPSFRRRQYQVTCLVCHSKITRADLLNKKRAVDAPTARTDKKRKKKRSELASMLASKKEQDTKKPLSLFEFMQ
ncbi:CIC11C00000003322 [Sungouiella intermedia]|uniref:CIC11C00000003322 n=1 Tax=Sungouiella intermedia TaxID=45354 RepID=A0A1L0DKE9_9ASCO|nr:CIC11C00000003322 [[Candida] intermedia]